MGKVMVLSLSILSLILVSLASAGNYEALTCPKDVKEASCHHNVDGIKHFKEGHWEVAAKHFKEAIKADPNFAEAHYNLALCMENLDKHGEAADHFKMAAKLAPKNDKIQNSEILKRHISH